ncbi:glycosyltransferase family 4 protein, partial [bacterium]|nr:glycosyltransferase family 4 protein [bacterium]
MAAIELQYIQSSEKMPRVLMMAQRYKPDIGGVEKHIEQISETLADRNYEVTVLTARSDLSLPERERIGATDIIRFPKSIERNPLMLLKWFISKKEILSEFQIVHCHDFIPILLWATPFRMVLPFRPIFATFHGYERDPVPTHFKYIRKGAEQLIRGSLCIGSFIEKVYGTNCNATPIGAVSQTKSKASGRHHVVYVGRLEQDTPILGYIEALATLTEEYALELDFTVCGDGSLKEKLEEYCQDKGITARFLGSVHDPTQYYLNADIALAGGFLSILEAMSYGLPVIAYSGTSLKHQYYKSVLTAGGTISIQSTAAGVAREIGRLMKSRALYQHLSERAVEFAEKNDWNRMANLYVKLWTGSC